MRVWITQWRLHMPEQPQESTPAPYEQLEVELAYDADCGGDGGWILLTMNGERIRDDTRVLSYFLDYLNQFGATGWELISITGGPYVQLHYDYRATTFQKPVTVTQRKW